MTFSVADATLIAVAGLAAKEIAAYFLQRKSKKANGKANGQDRVHLSDIKTDIGQIKTSVADIPVIKEKIDGINLRCKSHLESQALINSDVKREISELDERLFDHVKIDR